MIAAHARQGFGLWATTLRTDGTCSGRSGGEAAIEAERNNGV
jgi:hypothetical protein